MKPFFSIISPTYNCREKLEKTMHSVLEQDCEDFEYLVIDGGSRDGTTEWAKTVRDARVRVVSEPDQGIYDAMNKGICLAGGRYLNFLGAGDVLLPGALRRMQAHLPENGLTVAYGNALTPGDYIYDGEFTGRKLCHRNLCHQATFYGRRVFETIGTFDLKYPVMADWAFNLRCFGYREIRTAYVPILVAAYEGGGISEGGDGAFAADKEALIRKYLGWVTYARYLIGKGREQFRASRRRGTA